MGASDLAGRVVDRYEVGEQLGQGGFGAVYRARHCVVGNDVALKVLWPDRADDPSVVARFLQEARAAATLGSEHIVRVSDAGTTDDGLIWLAMELLEGRDLDDELGARGGRLPVLEAVDIVVEMLEGLIAAHARGIIHRDLKPANVFLARVEGRRTAKLLDFGISKVRGTKTLTQAGTILGTPHYMAPEQLSGAKLDARADLYATGTVLYELIGGRVPFEGGGYDVILKRAQGERPPDIRTLRPELATPLADVIMRALAVDRDARWPDAATMQHALRAAASGHRHAVGAQATLPQPSSPPSAFPPSSVPPSSGAQILSSPPSPSPSAGARSHASRSRASTILAPVQDAKPWQLGAVVALAFLLAIGVGTLGVLMYRVASRDDAPVAPTMPPTAGDPVVDAVADGPVADGPVADGLIEPSERPVPSTEPPELGSRTTPGPADEPTVPVPVPVPDTEARPEADAALDWQIFNYTGHAPRAEIDDLLRRAEADARRCALDRPLHLALTVTVNSMTTVARHHPARRSDDRDVADCVGHAIRRTSGPRLGQLQTAVFDLEVDLPARP